MSDIEKVKQLRKSTGAGFKDCNLAIKESDGDLDKAIEILRVKGIAKASKEQIKKWTKLSDNYLKSRKNLRRVFLLIDARRSIMPIDIDIMDIMDDNAVSYQIVLTKIDKILEVENLTELVLKEIEKRKAVFPNILITSSKKKYGVNEIKEEIISLID